MQPNPQSLQWLFAAVLQMTTVCSFGGSWGNAHAYRKDVQVKEYGSKLLSDLLDCDLAILEALSVYLNITASVLATAAGVTCETHHNHLRGGHILAMVAHNLEIVSLTK